MYLTAFAAAAAAFLITALGGKPLIRLLEKYRLTALLMREKDGVKTPDKKPPRSRPATDSLFFSVCFMLYPLFPIPYIPWFYCMRKEQAVFPKHTDYVACRLRRIPGKANPHR